MTTKIRAFDDATGREQVLPVATNTVIARAAGTLSAVAVSAQSLLLRGAADIADTTIADGNFVGRPLSGNLGTMTAAQARAILFPNQTFLDATVQTTNGTVTTLTTYATLADERVISLSITVVGRQPTTDDTIKVVIEAAFNRATGGTVTSKDENFVSTFKDTGAAAWDVTFVVSSQSIQIRVTGEAAKTIEWRVVGSVFEHGA